MSATTDSIKTQIKTAQDLITVRGNGLRSLVEMSEEGRRQRARSVLEGGQIKWIRGEDTEDTVRSMVQGTGKTPELYSVILVFDGASVKRHECDCHDHGRVGACKHVLAVAGAWILSRRREWIRLQQALKALNG